MASAVASLRGGLDLLSELFDAILETTGPAKAALLLPDDTNQNFVPWVSSQIDSTTQHRLRLTRATIDDGIGDGTAVTLPANLLGAQKPYFSSREFALIKGLRLLPFQTDGRIVAILLIIDSESLPNTADLSQIEALGTMIAEKIDGARAILGSGPSLTQEEAVRERLIEILNAASTQGTCVTLVRIDLDRTARELLSARTTADSYRFKRDLAAALATMVSGAGEFFSVGERHALLIVHSRTPYSRRLLTHQIAQGLQSLFEETPALPDISERVSRYPDNGKSVDEVIDAVLS